MQISSQLSSILTLIFIIVVLTMVSGCVQKNESEVQAPGIEIFKIGAILPLTGTQAYFGEEAIAGIKFAEKELKEELKEKRIELEVIYENSQNVHELAAIAANKLLNIKQVDCLISIFPMCPVINGVIQGKNVLHLAVIMSSHITKLSNTIKIYPSHVEEAQKMITYMESVKAQKVAIFHLTVKDQEEMVYDNIIPSLEKIGLKFLVETMGFTDVDPKAQMKKIKDFDPDFLILILLPDFHQKVFKAIHDVGGMPENCKIIGNISFLYTTDTPKEWLEDVVFIAPKHFIGGLDLPKEFIENFKKEYNQDPTIVSTFLYINVKILGEALLNGNTSSRDIINFLKNTKKQFKTVAGEIEILSDGDCTVFLDYGVIKGGKRLAFTLDQQQLKE